MFRSYKRAISFLIALPFILTVSALSEPAPEYDEYEQSRGESWDERYGEGEVAGDYMGSWTVAFCDEWVSLRARPDKNSERLLKVPKWADVEAYYYDGNWFECIYNGQRGYISRDYLTDRPGKFPDYPGNEDYQNNDIHSEYTDDSIAGYDTDYYTGTWEAGNYPDEYVDDWQLDYIGEYYVVNCIEWVSLWEHADDTSTCIKKVPLGALVTDCYDTIFDYYLCAYDGAFGFIRKQYLEPAVQDESRQQEDKSYAPVKPGNYFYVWNEYAEMNLYGGDQPSHVNIAWRNGYEVIENFAGSFNNGVSMGYMGNSFGDGLQNPKEWLMEVERHENGGENTILSFLARNIEQGDIVDVVGSELYAWRLGNYEGADTLSEEEFYEFLVTVNSLGVQYDIMIDMSGTFDEGEYISSLLLGEYPLEDSGLISIPKLQCDDSSGNSNQIDNDCINSGFSSFVNQSGLSLEQQADLSILTGKLVRFLYLDNNLFYCEYSNFLEQWLEYQCGVPFPGGWSVGSYSIDDIRSCVNEAILDKVDLFIVSGIKKTDTIEELCALLRNHGVKVISWDLQLDNVDVNWNISDEDTLDMEQWEKIADYFSSVMASTLAGNLTATNLYYE